MSGIEAPDLSHGRAINDTWYNRILILLAVRFTAWIRRGKETVIYPTSSLCIKYGELRHLPEAATLQFIAKNTKVPVPRVYCAFRCKNVTYILMEKVRGRKIAHGWGERSSKSKAALLDQLRQHVESIHRIPSPGPAVANSEGGRLWDCRLPARLYFGPFDNIDAFHRYLRRPIVEGNDKLPADVNELVDLHRSKDRGAPVFTYGDLSSLNIMVEGDTITAIIDWETAGWFPSYWEYTNAWNVNPRNYFWREEVDKFLTPLPEVGQRWELGMYRSFHYHPIHAGLSFAAYMYIASRQAWPLAVFLSKLRHGGSHHIAISHQCDRVAA